MYGIHELGPTGNRGQWQPPGNALGHGDQVRDHTFVFAGEPGSCPAEARLDLVGHQHHTMIVAPGGHSGQEPGGGDDEPPFTLDRLDQHAGDIVGADLLVQLRQRSLSSLITAHARGVAKRVGHRHPIDLGRKGTETLLVRHVLCREGHGEIGAAVIRVVEDHHCLATGGVAGNLDCVLYRFSSRVEQCGDLGMTTRSQGRQLFADGDVALIWPDHETGVGKPRHLVAHRLDHLGQGMANAGHPDA